MFVPGIWWAGTAQAGEVCCARLCCMWDICETGVAAVGGVREVFAEAGEIGHRMRSLA